ncbi:TetR/AcrR family transcriptional regulator [Catenuloplanes japonicus]|uniref:TetR/AcrR family transcriptional regulator n=1 Tax=Catenuloplanes japonicus TaxID=33876 RepID=UPI0018DAFEF3|nr:TetR/AcrR family transcriptional regulator [Catenuloplanes japonicus]
MNDSTTAERILDAASVLLEQGGIEALSNRAVAGAAGVQTPMIYRVFGDKQGFLDALALRLFSAHLVEKGGRGRTGDPVRDLRTGWDAQIRFGLQNPALYTLVYADPRPGPLTPAIRAATEMLAGSVHRVAEAGLLTVPEPHATQLIHSTGRGITLGLIALPEDERDLTVADLARDAVIAAITSGAPAPATSPVAHAIGMRAVLPSVTVLSAREQAMMEEWLDRVIAAQATSPR